MARKLLNISLIIGLVPFILVIYKTGLKQIISDFKAISLTNFISRGFALPLLGFPDLQLENDPGQ